MPYEGRTTEEALRKWHADVLEEPIVVLSRALGVDFYDGHRDLRWIEHAKTPGLYDKTDQRDQVRFTMPNPVTKIVRTIGDVRPDGDLDNKLALAATAGPDDVDSTETLSWKVGRGIVHTESTSMMHGWSATVTSGFEVEDKVSGVKVVGSLALGSFGQYGKEKADGKNEDVEGSGSKTVELKAGQIIKIMQTVQTGPGVADVDDRIVLDTKFEVRDWKEKINKRLYDHAGFRKAGRAKERVHWTVPDAYDLQTAFEGTNPRYPRQTEDLTKDAAVRRALEWMLDEANRTIRVRSQAHYDMSIFTSSRARLIGADGNFISEENV